MSSSKKPSTAVRPFGWADKIGYSLGDMGCNFSFQLVSTYMQLFYMQYIGIEEEVYAIIIILSKVFDAVNDIIIGNLVDTKRLSKKSKYMPWIIFGGVTLIIFNVMLFAPVTEFSQWGKYLWCLGAYCLWSIAYTMVNVPYGSLHSVITDKPQEKVSLSTFRSIGAVVPGLVVMMVLPDIVYDKNDTEKLLGEKFLPISLIFGIVALVAFIGLTKLVKERIHHNTADNAVGFRTMISSTKSFFTNRAMIGATIASVASVALFNSTMSLNNMVFQYFFADPSKMKLAMVGSYAPMVIFMVLMGKFTKKYGKKSLIVGAMLIGAVSGVASLILSVTGIISPDIKGMVIYVICLMGLNLGNAGFQIAVWAIVADCIQVSFIKTGKSEEGSLYAIYSFFRKLAQGIGQAVVALGLGSIGFVEGKDAVQPEGFGDKVMILYIILLAVGSFIAFLAMKFIYNIGKKEEEEFAKMIESKQ